MNCSKIIPPSPIFVDFYFYYSYFTLFLSLLITPFQFYIILTKSGKLKAFKWLIFHHSFWCFAFEFCFALVKPIFLAPAFGGFSLGLFQNFNYKVTAISLTIIIFLLINMISALGITILNRYMLVFPSKYMNLFTLKIFVYLTAIVTITCYISCIIVVYHLFVTDISVIHWEAMEYDTCFEIYLNEPGFVFVPYEITKIPLLILFISLLVYTFVAILLGIYFVYLIQTHKASKIAKFQLSLIVSSTIQLLVTLLFLIFPVITLIVIIYFQISNTANILCIIFCSFLTHSFLESFATLYFVTPFRKSVYQIYRKIFLLFQLPNIFVRIVPVTPYLST